MNDIEFFHYYRQDVINSSYDGRRFFRVGRGDTAVIRLKDVMKNIRKLKDECRTDYDMVEEHSIISTEDGKVQKEYRVCIFGEDGNIGFFFQLRTPLFIEERAGARASPQQRLKRKRI